MVIAAEPKISAGIAEASLHLSLARRNIEFMERARNIVPISGR